MPMDARMVVISQVPSSPTTVGSASSTSFSVMITSVCSLPMYSAAFRAYFRSIASTSIPMAKVRIGWSSIRCAMAQTREESRPPESRNPSGASASSRFSTPSISRRRSFGHTSSSVFMVKYPT